jgi:tetratricopeptide (TPR) repeat protein
MGRTFVFRFSPSILGLLAIVLVVAGWPARALAQTTSALQSSDPEWAECVGTPRADCILQRALERAASSAPQTRGDEFVSIADVALTAGLSGTADKAIDQAVLTTEYDRSYLRGSVLSDVARLLARSGRYAKAEEVAQSIDAPLQRGLAIALVAIEMGKAGDFDQGLRLLRSISDKPSRARAIRRAAFELRATAVARREEDKFVDALRDVEAIEREDPPQDFRKGFYFSLEFTPPPWVIVEALAGAGRFADALELASSIDDPDDRFGATTDVARAAAKSGQVAESIRIARTVRDQQRRSRMLDIVLNDTIDPLEIFEPPSIAPETKSNALRQASNFYNEQQRVIAVAILAKTLAMGGAIESAQELLPQIQQPGPRFVVLFELAKAQARAGQQPGSVVAFLAARQIALASEDRRDRRLSAIAQEQAKAGQIEPAREIVGLIKETNVVVGDKVISEDWDRGFALYEIARAEARADRVDDAFRTARSFGSIRSGVGVVAEGLAEAGRIPEALSAALEVKGGFDRARLLSNIVRERVAAGEIAEAQQIAKAIERPSESALAFGYIASAQRRLGLVVECDPSCRQALVESIQSTTSPDDAVRALTRIASVLAQ